MLAVDTNVVVRIVTRDNLRQAERARMLVERNDIFVSTTVILETEWVLRSVYNFDTAQIGTAVRSFAGLPRVTLEDPQIVSQALDWAGHGLDFADALHMARAKDCDAFVTFDEPLARAAKKAGAMEVRAP